MTSIFPLLATLLVAVVTGGPPGVHPGDLTEIVGYHFHTYFFERNPEHTKSAVDFRDAVQEEITKGILEGCRLAPFWLGAAGPHPIGSFETCCNSSALSRSMSYFIQNRPFNLSILLHPLTRWEVRDHTERALWLGQSMPLDLTILEADLGEDGFDHCNPIPGAETGVRQPPAVRQSRKEAFKNQG